MGQPLTDAMTDAHFLALGKHFAAYMTEKRQAPDAELVDFLAARVRQGDAAAARILRFLITCSGSAFFEEIAAKDYSLLAAVARLGHSSTELQARDELMRGILEAGGDAALTEEHP